MSYDRLAARLFNTPLLCTQEKAETLAAVFTAFVEGRSKELPPFEPPPRIDLASSLSLRRTDGGYFMSSGGIAVLQVHGSLMQRADGLDALSGMTGYNRIGGQLTAAQRDPGVRGIVLEVDSPGGEVAGLLELAGIVADSEKPVWAHANEIAMSAAYWLASSAGKIFAPTTGMLGSIGVVFLHVDRSKQIEKAGLVYTPIFAGARKIDLASFAPLSEPARATAQTRVDQVYAMFTEHVANARKIDEQAVRDTEAGIYSIQDAVGMQLADEIATLGDVVQMMTDDLNAGKIKQKWSYGRAADLAQHDDINPKGAAMSKENPAAPSNAAITQAEHEAAIAKAKAEGVAEGKAAATNEAMSAAAKEVDANAAKAATERVRAITQCDAAKTRPVLAAHLAFETTMSAAEAQALLGKAASEVEKNINPLDAKMRALNPKAGPDNPQKDGDEQQPKVDTRGIYARMQTGLTVVK